MDTVNFLGISIVGQSNKGGDGGIYVGSIMKGFVVCVSRYFLHIAFGSDHKKFFHNLVLSSSVINSTIFRLILSGAVALDGRIEPGDMILQVNEVNFEDMSNDDAVRVLREAVQKPG